MKMRHLSERTGWLAKTCAALIVAGAASAGGEARADERAIAADEPGAATTGGSATTEGEASDEAKARAKGYNTAATKLFNLGDFAGAANRYHKAYAAMQAPVFLYNLAQCYRRMPGLKNQQKALFFYKSFLQNAKDPSAREDLESEIAAVRQRVEQLKLEQARAEAERKKRSEERTENGRKDLVVGAQQTPAPAPTPFYHKWWFWSIVGAAVAGATSAILVSAWPQQSVHEGSLHPGQIQMP